MRVPPVLATFLIFALASAYMADAGCSDCTLNAKTCNSNSFYCCGTTSYSCQTYNGAITSLTCGMSSTSSPAYSDSGCNNVIKAATASPQHASMAACVAAGVALVVMMIAAF